jgi:D-lyxose ketol-isomerase
MFITHKLTTTKMQKETEYFINSECPQLRKCNIIKAGEGELITEYRRTDAVHETPKFSDKNLPVDHNKHHTA